MWMLALPGILHPDCLVILHPDCLVSLLADYLYSSPPSFVVHALSCSSKVMLVMTPGLFLYVNLSHALRGVLFLSPCCWGTQAVMDCEIMVIGIQHNLWLFLCDIVCHVMWALPVVLVLWFFTLTVLYSSLPSLVVCALSYSTKVMLVRPFFVPKSFTRLGRWSISFPLLLGNTSCDGLWNNGLR